MIRDTGAYREAMGLLAARELSLSPGPLRARLRACAYLDARRRRPHFATRVFPSSMDAALARIRSLRAAYAGEPFIRVVGLEEAKALKTLDPEALNNTNRLELYVFGSDDVRQARARIADVSLWVAAEAALASPASRLRALIELQPALVNEWPKGEHLRQSLAAWAETEPRLAFARQGFNDAADTYNRAIHQWPTRLLAPALGFRSAGRV